MASDYWGFKNVKELERDTSDFPETILKEQIALLGEKTEFVLYGKPLYMNVTNEKTSFKAATIFNIVVPVLDNYTKTILIMYSNLESIFPVAISIGKSFIEDMENFEPAYTCSNLEEFKKALKNILKSDDIMNVIKTLYSKANMINN